jgi:hypothetical protein
MGEVTELDVPYYGYIAPAKMAQNIDWDNLKNVLILAVNKDGSFSAYSSNGDIANNLLMVECWKYENLACMFDDIDFEGDYET